MAQHGKKYRAAIELLESSKAYSPQDAVGIMKKASYVKFDETVELHMRMGLDPRAADQQVRGVVAIPHGLGKKVRILVFAQGEAARIAQESGADYIGADDMVKKIEEGWLDFDVTMATPDMMSKVGKLGKILGRKGLMPNPKSGTVVQPADIGRAVNEARKGRVEFRLDRTAIIHVPLGKVSFEEQKIIDNLSAIAEAVIKAKPAGAKGQYIRSAFLASTMGPGIKLELRSMAALSDQTV